jgi:hypothetical protein
MNTSQSLLDILTGLGVRSAGLGERAEDWLKLILADSLAYQRLKEKGKPLYADYIEKKKNASTYLILFAIVVILYVLLKKQTHTIGLLEILIGIFFILLAFVFLSEWISSAAEYRAAVKKAETFAGQWVERVRAVPANVEKLADLHQKIQDCEAIMRKKSSGYLFISREQTLEYILNAQGDPAQALNRYFSAVENGHFNGIIQGYLLHYPLPYALVYQAAPREFAAFMDACYAQYAESPYGFDGTCVERVFDQVILKTAGG